MAKFAPAISISVPSEISEETTPSQAGSTTITTNPSRPASAISIEPTYQMKPTQHFSDRRVQFLVDELLTSELKGKRYDSVYCKDTAQRLAGLITEKVKAMSFPRYKYVTSVSIGSIKEKPGIQMASRCIWDDSTDDLVTVNYMNGHLFAVVMVYGVYLE